MYLRLSKIGKISNIEDKLFYLRKHDTNVSSVYAEDQIKNSIISREIYLNSNTLLISKKIYDEYKRQIDKKNIYKFYIKVQTRIVYFENNPTKLNSIFTIILKIIRRILKHLLWYLLI